MTTTEKIVDKIRKILALAAGAGTQEEAFAAMLHAQRLMAAHGIDPAQVSPADAAQAQQDPTWTDIVEIHLRKAWTDAILTAVMRNFRVYALYDGKDDRVQTRERKAGSRHFHRLQPSEHYVGIKFFGEPQDVEVASMIYTQALQAALRLANTYAANPANVPPGKKRGFVYFSYLDGFAAGLVEAFGAQVAQDAALVRYVEKPPHVVAAHAEWRRLTGTQNAQTLQATKQVDGAHRQGAADGRQFGSSQKGVTDQPRYTRRLLGA